MFGFRRKSKASQSNSNTLFGSALNIEHRIKGVSEEQQEIASFLRTLGCYEGESVTIISVLSDTYVISVKDARYSIDADLAKAITLY